MYPKSMFYAVSWKWLFDPEMAEHALEITKNSSVILVSNKVIEKTRIKIGGRTAYEVIAKKNCPKIYFSRINYSKSTMNESSDRCDCSLWFQMLS